MSLLHPRARLIEASTDLTLDGAGLSARVSAAAAAYTAMRPGVVFVRIPMTADGVVGYLGAWQARRPLALLDPDLAAETLADLVDRYEPAVVTSVDAGIVPAEPPDGYDRLEDPLHGASWVRRVPSATVPHPDLGVLLATSGSTGSPKLVRLSRAAILANTTSIVQALCIGPDEVAISSLPFFYSFGMSVLNTHLAAGATVVLETDGLLQRPFWRVVDERGVTSLAAVPYQYEMLRRLRFDPARYPTLRTLTQAGGRLRPELVTEFNDRMTAVGGRMYVMYGQTEAGPRMTTLPAERLAAKVGSVGPAVPGGRLSIRLEDGSETTAAGTVGEVVYRGPNVMLGYAETAADLALGDEQGGVLATGDLGSLDADGYLSISGRLQRFGKVFGVRLNLDDIERLLHGHGPGPVAAVSGDDKVVVWLEGADPSTLTSGTALLADRLHLHRSGFDLRTIDALPLLGNGKVDYRALEQST